MTHRYIKLAVTIAVLVSAFGALLYTTLREGTEYFKHVDEVVADRAAWEGKALQLHGYVVPGSWKQKPNTLEYIFKVQNDPARRSDGVNKVDVRYTGILPDTFKDEAEVVLKGRFSGDRFDVVPNGVTAKCPSKYEEASKAAKSTLAGS